VADLIERIGREIDMYRRFALEPTLLEVSREAHVALTRLLRKKAGVPDDAVPVSLRIGDREIPYRVNRKMIGAQAFKLHTRLGITPPEIAIRRAFVNRSEAIPARLFEVHPKLRLS
jgi:hypothetical protein